MTQETNFIQDTIQKVFGSWQYTSENTVIEANISRIRLTKDSRGNFHSEMAKK
jgi:hypothetical protein